MSIVEDKGCMGSNPIPRTTIGPLAVDTFSVVQWLKSQGRKESTVLCTARKLRYLAKNVDLNNPDKVKLFIASLQCSDGHKDNLIDIYSQYCKFNNIQWTKPKYQREERITRIPKEEQINKIISHSTLRYAVAYSIIRDIGLRPVELGMLRVKDIDLETGEVYPITAKHGAGRILKLRDSTLAMLKEYISKNNLTPMDMLWNSKRVKDNWAKQKVVVSRKLGEPELRQIRLYDLRHFAGSMCYYKTKDIIYTMRFLGHKNIKNTLRYVHLVNFDKEEYLVKATESVEEAKILLEQGFDYVTELDGIKLFRKRK
jgi:integrase